jgi:hypothetical protein
MTAAPRIYRHVERGMWTSADFLALSAAPKPNARDLWHYLLSGPPTDVIPGLFVFSIAEAAEYFRWPVKGTRECFDEILGRGMARYDEQTRLVWLPKAMKDRNLPASPNVVRSWRRAWGELPDCSLKREAQASIQASLEGIGKAFGEGFLKAFREVFGEGSAKPLANQEQEQILRPPPPDLKAYRADTSGGVSENGNGVVTREPSGVRAAIGGGGSR